MICTPKFDGDGITAFVKLRHNEVIGNVLLAIQIEKWKRRLLERRKAYVFDNVKNKKETNDSSSDEN